MYKLYKGDMNHLLLVLCLLSPFHGASARGYGYKKDPSRDAVRQDADLSFDMLDSPIHKVGWLDAERGVRPGYPANLDC